MQVYNCGSCSALMLLVPRASNRVGSRRLHLYARATEAYYIHNTYPDDAWTAKVNARYNIPNPTCLVFESLSLSLGARTPTLLLA